MPVVVAVREKATPALMSAGDEVTESILAGRTENASVEHAVVVPSLITAARFLYAVLSVKLADNFLPESPETKVRVWLPPVIAVSLVHAALH